jgi:hypothetical protein
MEILAQILGSEARAKLMRFFLFNPENSYRTPEIKARTGLGGFQIEKNIRELCDIGFLRKRLVIGVGTEEKPEKNGGKGKGAKNKSQNKKIKDAVYFLNTKFPHLAPLSDLIADTSVKADQTLVSRIASAGKIKLIIASGIFVRRPDARIDLLVVGDKIDSEKLAKNIASLEQEIGRELSYSFFDSADFEYRNGMNDRLIRDVLDFPYLILVNRIAFKEDK